MESQLPVVFFNASVILAGTKSPQGGAGLLLDWCSQHKIQGVVSEIVVDEVRRHLAKIGHGGRDADELIKTHRLRVMAAPQQSQVADWLHKVTDPGDAHILASSTQAEAKFLVTLDQRHLLVLHGKVRQFVIVSPGQLITRLRKRAEVNS